MNEAPRVTLTVKDGVAVIVVDNPPVNAISHAVRAGILAAVSEIEDGGKVEAAVLTAAGRTFMSGSDIREFDFPQKEPHLELVNAALEALAVPIVAAIHGTALGGGFELAMACHYRVADAKAKVGLPEVNLGLIPGAGGTQRLPRLIGAKAALELIQAGRHVAAPEALKLGMIDEIAMGDVLATAIAAAKRLAVEKNIPRTRARVVSTAGLPADFFAEQRAAAQKKFRGFPAPMAAVDLVEAAVKQPFAEGRALEAEASRHFKASAESKALRHLFFAEREVARIPDVPKDTPVRAIQSVGVIGAGTMGRGIALSFLNAGFPVIIVETKQEALDRGLAAIDQTLARDVGKGRLPADQKAERLARLNGALDLTALAGADLIIEAAFENMVIKRRLFAQLDKVCKPGAILASNTSTLDLNHIAAATSRPADVIGTHFFSPANIMRLLEIVRGRETAKDVVATLMDVAKRIGKVGVLSGVCFGFIGNRMFEGYVRESQRLLLEGATPGQVDKALTDFGMAMGPCAVCDLAGLDVSYLTREGNRAHMPNDPSYCVLGDKLYHLGRLGQKTGTGFYLYENGKAKTDPDVETLIRAEASRLGIEQRAITDEEIVERCLLPMISEAAQILDEGIALRASDIDVVWCTGYGFPRFRGGPLWYADGLGLANVVTRMAAIAARLGNPHGYWTPAPLLKRLAAEGKGFGDLAK